MTKESLLDRLERDRKPKAGERERASQILGAVEGMSIWEAREILERCIGALQLLDVCYRES